jgi:hypothetical protein
MKISKYLVPVLGYLLVLSCYIAIKSYQLQTKDTAKGEVVRMISRGFTAHSLHGDYHDDYPCVDIHFQHKSALYGTDSLYDVSPQTLSYKQYLPGEKVTVMFPKGHPELAVIYSMGEFWFAVPNMVIVGAILLFWSVACYIFIAKPWIGM